MRKHYSEKNLEVKQKLADTEDELLQGYLSQIIENYNSSESVRLDILRGLERISMEIQSKGKTLKIGEQVIDYERGIFDREIARKVRENLISKKGLIKELELSSHAIAQLHDYENGKSEIIKFPRGKFPIRYLKWLKEQGYDPFDLELTPEELSQTNFRGDLAKKLRIGEGLIVRELLNELGFPQHREKDICKYEAGKTLPENPPKKELPKAYLDWLKERGYNPYKLNSVEEEFSEEFEEGVFNGKIARKIREDAGLTLEVLEQELGFRKGSGTYIVTYEKCKTIPRNPPKGELPKAYLNWLKEQGYNPYGL